MSSSAFTPTQIEVTNNVPVNVPVVTAWENYTPTFNGFGTPTGIDARWMRVGTSLKAQIKFTSGTVSATTARISIPSGLTIDSSAQNKIIGTVATQTTTTTGIPTIALVFVESGQTTNISFSNTADGTTSKSLSACNATQLFNSNFAEALQFEVPIAEWSGSGTTTLATRAVEEYAWNSSTSTLDDSTSFAYGPSGVTFKAFAPTGVNYVYRRVRFQTAIQATDSILLEINDGTTNNWLPAASAFYPYQQNDAGTTNYGVAVTRVGGSSTDVDVRFFSQATKTSGDTWSANSTWKWRLRKVSSGAQVGYPVSARNIVGDTSGSVVPTGMVGEVRSFTARTIAAVTTGMTASAALDTLPAGRWHIVPNVTATAAASATTIEVIISSNNANDGTGSIGSYSAANTSGVTSGNWGFPLQNCILDVSTSQTLYAKAQSTGANRNAIVSGYAIRIA